jgi:hypothetical protein
LIFFLKTSEHLKVTTLLASSTKFSPVAGFLPLRGAFFFAENFPNLLIRTSSPDSRVFLISSKIVSNRQEIHSEKKL